MSRISQQIRFCTSRDGVRIAYATDGSGPPLVHPQSWLSHLDLDWENPVQRSWLSLLMRRHRLIRYDARGSGLSDREGIDFSFQRLVEDLEAVVEAAGLQRFALLGMGGGGAVAMHYAVRHPTRVSCLVLYGCPTRGRSLWSAEQLEEAQARLKAIELGWRYENPAFRQLFTSLLMPDATPEQARAFIEQMRVATTPSNAASITRTFYGVDSREVARQVRCPMLVLHAREDAQIPFEEGRFLAGLIPNARFVPLESRNHRLLESEPAWQQLATELDHFLPAPDRAEGAIELALHELTPREREVLEIMARGLDNGRIAAQLRISEKTVRNHVSIIFSKLGFNNRAQAVARARDAGFGRQFDP